MKIDVDTARDTVSLYGFGLNEATRLRTKTITKAVSGVVDVDNNLTARNSWQLPSYL